jgi:hypothetical protein
MVFMNMEWGPLGEADLTTAPLIRYNGYSVESGGVEFRNGKFIIQEDDSISLTCNSPELRVRNIRPNEGHEYTVDESGLVVFGGSALEGDRYGDLQIGIFHNSLDYPLEVIAFSLIAPFSVEGEVKHTHQKVLEITQFKTNNEHPLESTRYPYFLEYNLSAVNSEEKWDKLPLYFTGPGDFRRQPEVDAPIKLSTAYDNGHPVRIRLQSALGETYLFRAICKRKEIIRFAEPCPPVPLLDWIQYPKALNIVHEKYRFNENTMEESWEEFPMLNLESAVEWVDFEPLDFTAQASMNLHDSGEFIEMDLVLDLSESKDLIQNPADFLLTLEPFIGQEKFQFQNLNNFSINNETYQICFSTQQPLLKERVEFKPRTTKMKNYSRYNLNFGEKFYSNSPFSKTNWGLRFILSHSQKPLSPSLTSTTLAHWKDPLIVQHAGIYSSRFHPRHAKLFKAEFKRITPTKGMFCIECGTMGFPSPGGIFLCPKYGCGWTNKTLDLTGFEEIDEAWFDYRGKTAEGNHRFLLNTNRLSSGKYVVAFNGMSFHFDVS